MYEKKNWKNNMDTFFGNLSQHVNGISYNIGWWIGNYRFGINEDYSEDTVYSMLRGNNLSFGTTTVKKIASNKVGVSGITVSS